MATTASNKKIVFYGLTDGVYGPIAMADVLAALGLTPTAPVVTKPEPEPVTQPEPVKPVLAGSPRVLVGKATITGLELEYGVFEGIPRLAEIISRTPDAFRFRGGNYPFIGNGTKEATEAKKIAVTDYDGRALPITNKLPAGYYVRYFPDATSGLDYYYEQGNKPNEVFVAKPVVKPVTPVVTPDEPKGNQGTVNTPVSYALGSLYTGTPNQAS